jgi:hypothetical protein
MKPKTFRGQLKHKLKEMTQPKPEIKPRFEGKGTRARLNTAASKIFFQGNSD